MGIEPLRDRINRVGGIESIVVDGHRWYCGFDYGSDLVLSPLIEGRDMMAAFASEHMLQVDGRHGPAYWLELVEMSVEVSELAEDADRHINFRAGKPTICASLSSPLPARRGMWLGRFAVHRARRPCHAGRDRVSRRVTAAGTASIRWRWWHSTAPAPNRRRRGAS